MSSPYIMLNPPLSDTPSVGRTYIYVMLLNTRGGKDKPFYVGQTADIKKRLKNHSQLTWHYAKFNAPAKVYIAGSVSAINADFTEQDLIRKLSMNDYLLTNHAIKSYHAKKVQRETDFTSWTKTKIEAYNRTDNVFKVLGLWQRVWKANINNNAHLPYFKRNSDITAQDIIGVLNQKEFSNEEDKEILIAISKNFNSELKSSTTVLSEQTEHKYQDLTKKVRRLGRFYITSKKFAVNKEFRFKLSKSFEEEVREFKATRA